MNFVARHRFLALLVSLVLLIVIYPIFHESFSSRLVFDILGTTVIVAAIVTVLVEPRRRVTALILGLPLIASLWGETLIDSKHPAVIVGRHLLTIVFHVYMTALILRAIHREPCISVDGVFGAFCGYLLIGLAFSQLYLMIEELRPGSFQGEPFTTSTDRRQLLVYFSLITLTTVGYGDIVPAIGAVRGLAMAEALLGQFYVAAFVAELIGKRVSQVLSVGERQSAPPESGPMPP